MHKPVGWIVGIIVMLAVAWFAYKLLVTETTTPNVRDNSLVPGMTAAPGGTGSATVDTPPG